MAWRQKGRAILIEHSLLEIRSNSPPTTAILPALFPGCLKSPQVLASSCSCLAASQQNNSRLQALQHCRCTRPAALSLYIGSTARSLDGSKSVLKNGGWSAN